MTSILHGAGYFINNQLGPAREKQEDDVLTCAHCQAILLAHAWREEGGFCRSEMKPLCLRCADRALVYGCEPFMKKLEGFTRSQYRYQQFLKVAGLEPPPAQRPIITGG